MKSEAQAVCHSFILLSSLFTMRLFVSIPLPPVAQAGVRHLSAQMANALPDLRWTNPLNLHVTLKFLGEVDEVTAAGAKKALGSVSPGAPLMLRFGKARLLGPTKGVLALELTGDVEQLVDLQSRIEASFGRLGFSREDRPFLPHVTVARFNSGRPPGQLRVKIEPPKPWFNATSVCLMHSKQDGSTPAYDTLLNVPMIDPLDL
jgi:2'-5' RNA ligase